MKKTTKIIIASAFLFIISFVPFANVRAESVLWNTVIQDHLYHRLPAGIIDYRFTAGKGGVSLQKSMSNTNVTVQYRTRVVNEDTGALLQCGDNVPVGSKVRFEFGEHLPTDIYWFSTGTAFDSPYGSWSPNANRGVGGMCSVKNYFWKDRKNATEHYSDLAVNPPTKTITGTTRDGCINTGIIARCKLDEPGNVPASFNFAQTIGKFYFGYSRKIKGAERCFVLDEPLQRLSGTSERKISFKSNSVPLADFILQVPSQTIACPINFIEPRGTAPNAPQVTGGPVCRAGVPYEVTITGTDPDTNPEESSIRYGIDWNNDGKADQLLPATGYVPSGTSLRASRVWRTAGVHTFQVYTEDKQGLISPWTSFTTVECLEPNVPLPDLLDRDTYVPDLLDRDTYGSFPDGTLDFSFDKGVTNDICVATWNATYVEVCALYKNNEKIQDLPESGTAELTPGTYKFECRQINDGALLSETRRCLLNPDSREI
jgi:hypothetical protein